MKKIFLLSFIALALFAFSSPAQAKTRVYVIKNGPAYHQHHDRARHQVRTYNHGRHYYYKKVHQYAHPRVVGKVVIREPQPLLFPMMVAANFYFR